MKKFLISISISCLLGGLSVSYASRNVPGIDIVSRTERGADESWKRWNSPRLQSGFDHPEYEIGRIAGRGALELLDEEKEQDIIREGTLMSDFLQTVYPRYFPQVVSNVTELGNLLNRPWKYTGVKNTLTIHHTADAKQYRFPSDSQVGLLEIYRQHTVVKDRGDIGYNFLIDPQGRVYEGRSGGAGVVGGHANIRNSMTSLGVALLGNFENVHPTSKALHSLKHLATVVTYQYSIDPNRDAVLFNRSDEEPFLKAHTHDESILGHKDIKSTACPGEYLYSEIPQLTQEVAKRLKRISEYKQGGQLIDSDFITLQRPTRSDDDLLGVFIPREGSITMASCQQFSQTTGLVSCSPALGGVRVELSYLPQSSGWHTIGVTTDVGSAMVSFAVVRNQDIQADLAIRKQQFAREDVSLKQKMTDRIVSADAKQYLADDISVLLYEPTASSEVTLVCEGGCEVEVDGLIIANANDILLREEGENIVGFIDLVRYDADAITVRHPRGGVIQITSFERYSGERPLNIYRGELVITRQGRRNLDTGMQDGFTVVNRLSFKEYLRGMGESSEAQHFEKTKALAYLTKTYALFYRSGSNMHPSIPASVNYTAIDDPRSFQRYLGAGIESVSPNRLQAVDATYQKIPTYDGYIPILPYYHCSGGFTRSGSEKFGWTDTPWLTSKKDLVACESGQFEGHGVGMSGDGAEYLAQAGASAEEILEWYYEGIEFDT